MQPVNQPLLTHLLGEELAEKALVSKPTARGTSLRYSSAHACARQQGYAGFGAVPTEPMDFPGAWVTGLGTMVHEALQDAIGRKYPNAQFEVSSQQGDISGSCDALIFEKDLGEGWYGGNVLYELKTMGTYSFDQQVGWNRMRATFSTAQGPALKAIAQAGMNALGIEKELGIKIDTIIMGSITFEALSKQKSARMNVEDHNRVLAEFWLTRDEWEPVALAELERINKIAADVEAGYISDRVAIDDNGREKVLSPSGSDWNCHYCQFHSICVQDGPGAIWINDSSLVARKGQ